MGLPRKALLVCFCGIIVKWTPTKWSAALTSHCFASCSAFLPSELPPNQGWFSFDLSHRTSQRKCQPFGRSMFDFIKTTAKLFRGCSLPSVSLNCLLGKQCGIEFFWMQFSVQFVPKFAPMHWFLSHCDSVPQPNQYYTSPWYIICMGVLRIVVAMRRERSSYEDR